MKNILFYYLFISICYFAEITLFLLIFPLWDFDVIWLNLSLRAIFVVLFALTLQRYLYRSAVGFYRKFFLLAILNPLFSSILLKIFIVALWHIDNLLLYVKLLSDVINSLLFYYILKKIA